MLPSDTLFSSAIQASRTEKFWRLRSAESMASRHTFVTCAT